MKNLIFVVITFAMLFTFCKKKETISETTQTNQNQNTITSSSPSLTPANGVALCQLQTIYSYFDFNGNVTKDSAVIARFQSAQPTTVAPTDINAGVVTLNNVNIPFQSSSNIYNIASALPINISGPLTWSVAGAGTVTAFSQSFTPSYPKYTGGSLLPDSFSQANGVTINIDGVTNYQLSIYGAAVYLSSGSIKSSFQPTSGTNGSVSFSSAELSSFPVNQPITINIYIMNAYNATHGGIKRCFMNGINYQKVSYLKQ